MRLYAILASVDFSLTLTLLSSLYHAPGTRGHPYHSPLTPLKIELVKRFMQIRSYAEVYRRLQSSVEWRRVCDIGSLDKIPHPSTWTRFRKRVGAATLQLNTIDIYNASTIAVDATFIKAYSKRDPKNNLVGYSDSEAGLRKEGRNVTLGYGVHLAADTKSEMPLAAIVEPANTNEKKPAPTLLKETIKRRRKRRVRHVIADSQYSSQAVREEVKRLDAKPVIPYPRNQAKGRRVLRVDRRFRSHESSRLRRLYRKRSAAERVVSRLKTYFGLCQLRTRGLRNVSSHVLLCIIALLANALSAIKQGLSHKIRSPIHFTKLTWRR